MEIPTDIISIDSLHCLASIGADCWGRARAQLVEVSIYLHLQSGYLNRSGNSDDVVDSVDYSQLSKALVTLFKTRENDGSGFDSTNGLIKTVAAEAFKLGDAVVEARVVLNVPRLILLAEGFTMDSKFTRGLDECSGVRLVSVKNLVLPVIIGVNPPERETKQRVITNIIFHENKIGKPGHTVDYAGIVKKLVADIEVSSYLTLEKFVMEIVRAACLSSESLHAVTVRVQKPSALSIANSSGVEITRLRSFFVPSI